MERFTISLDERLAQQFDTWLVERSCANRSEAVRDLLRAELSKAKLRGPAGRQCVACLSYVFNHHERDLGERLTSMQRDHHHLTVSTMHDDWSNRHSRACRTAARFIIALKHAPATLPGESKAAASA